MSLEVECLKYGTCSSYFCLSSKFTFFHMVHLLRAKTKFLKHEPYHSKLVSSPTKKIWLRFTTTMEFSKWYLWFWNLPIFLTERKKKKVFCKIHGVWSRLDPILLSQILVWTLRKFPAFKRECEITMRNTQEICEDLVMYCTATPMVVCMLCVF